ncbi:hypothetical protein AURDEDRAFT_180356 [Auricularia subglabra TFB-10046 SS5]|nr:hypothetical protein AURDEDRAFT_180356 [Auricularia subglabra TFB-10046 SS5]
MSALSQLFRTSVRANTRSPSGDEPESTTLPTSNLAAASSSRATNTRVVGPLTGPIPDAQASPTEDRSFIEILVPRTIVFRGVGQDVEPVRLSGTVVLHLAEPAVLKDVILDFTGKAKLPVPPSPDVKPQTSYAIYNHDISFMPQANQTFDKKQSRTFKAGRHAFPFDIDLEAYLPSSLHAPRAQIGYKLRATAVRSSLLPNYTCSLPINVVRSFGPNSLEYQQTIEVESTWQGKLMYSLTLPHKAWAAGDTIITLVKFQPLAKGVSVAEVRSMIIETAQYSGLAGIEMKKDVCSARHIFSCPSSSSQSASERTQSEPRLLSEGPPPISAHAGSAASGDVASGDSGGVNEEGHEVVAKVELKIPSWTCPSHSVAPINVSHRIVWVINISNSDGHTSELRCSLPIHILSHHVLEEAIQASAPTRRLLFGIDDLILPVSEQVELPSYHAHVQDPVADAADGWPPHASPAATPAPGSARVRSLSNPSIPASRVGADPALHEFAQRHADRDAGSTSRREGAPAAHGARSSGRPLSSRALSTVPSYDTASRGGVPPLSSAAGLPSYAEAAPGGLRARHVVRRSCSDGSLATRAIHTERRDPASAAVPRTSAVRSRPARAAPPPAGKSLFLRGPTRMVPPGVPFASTWLTQQRTVNR